MATRFSEKTLQHSTYLFERNAEGEISKYVNERNNLTILTSEHPEMEPFVKQAIAGLSLRSKLITSGKNPFWVDFYPQLISLIQDETNHKTLDSYFKHNKYYFDTIPYAFPFVKFLRNFINYFDRNYNTHLNENSVEKIYKALGNWYIEKAIKTSRYVLHLCFKKSKLSYKDWCNLFEDNGESNPWLSIANEFPVLIRWLANIFLNTKNSIDEFFKRLNADRSLLEDNFSISRQAKLIDIHFGLSDPHQGGRSVLRLTFDDNNSIIYKPKSINIENEFNNYVFCNREGTGIVGLKILPRKNYGWAEDAGIATAKNFRTINNPSAIGKASSIFWLLNATDLHVENIMPLKKGVYALDLETLFNAQTEDNLLGYEPYWRNHSINVTLLFNATAGINQKTLNISAFNPSENIELPNSQISFILNNDTVEMLATESKQLASGILSVQDIYPKEKVKKIVTAFKMTCNLEKEKLKRFIERINDNCILRLVFRDTYFYGRLLERMRQPRFMRDGALMTLDLMNLHIGLPNKTNFNKGQHKIIDDEIIQLLNGDIPYFTYLLGELSLHTSQEKINNFFKLSGKEASLKKINEIEESDINEQVSLLSIALGNYQHENKTEIKISNKLLKKNTFECSDSFLLNLSEYILKIVDSAFIPSNSPARWLSLFGDVSGEDLRVDVGDNGFFGGSLGILTSLQAAETTLFSHTDLKKLSLFLDEQAKVLSIKMSDFIKLNKNTGSELLGYSGLGGKLFALSLLINFDNDRWFFISKHFEVMLENLEEKISNDIWLDVIGGVSGFILGCEQILLLNINTELRAKVVRLQELSAKRLMNQIHRNEFGYSWIIPTETYPLLGFAHGWSGIITALHTVAYRTTNIKLKIKIHSLIKESSGYPNKLLEVKKEWFDYREGINSTIRLNRSWCNGVPGFLNGMLKVKEYWTNETSIRIETMVQEMNSLVGSSDAFRFCCGEMGNLDFLLDIDRQLSFKNSKSKFDLMEPLEKIIESANNYNLNRIPEQTFPALFQGQSGLVYCAIRFLNKDIPSLSGSKVI